jgi:fimbrial isopeptide formation D2 family protein
LHHAHADNRPLRTRTRRGLFAGLGKRLSLIAVATVIALVGSVSVAAPAFAANARLTITKLVNGQPNGTFAPGQEFTYTIEVGCDDVGCLNAVMTDPLPAQFAGFSIVTTSVTPSVQPSTFSYSGCTTVVTANCQLTTTFREPFGAGQVGIAGGETYMVSITLKIPTGLDPASPINNIAVPNTATAVSDSADTVASTANVTVAIPITVDTTVGKTWAPASQQFAPGTASTVTLMSGNTSNVPAASLALQDPDAAADDATTLTAANPFTIVDFAGFGTVTAPQGANQVQVDAYVFDMISGKWAWKTGPPSTIGAIALPDGVANADVGGLRFTFTDAASGATIVPAGTQGSVPVNVTQRATNRNTGAGLIVGTTVTNKVAGTVTVPGRPPVTKTATAPYAITPLTVSVQAGKTITPARIPAGTSATASVTGKNTSNGPLTSLTLSDTGYFTDKLGFGGFTTPISYPTGATAATVTWFFSDGSSSQAAVAAGATPIAPSPPAGEHLTGFAVAFTGAIAAGVTATINFSISPAADVAAASSPVQFPNTVVVTGVNAAGSATANKQAPLAVFRPDISLTIDKTISPVGAVTPGGTVVVKLPTTTSTDSAFVNPSTIVVEDDWRSSTTNDFWNAFDPIAVAPTQIPAGAGLVVTYVAGGATKTLDTVTASASPQLFQEAFPTADLGSITSVTYTFTNPAGFGQGATVTPNTIFQARATLRDDPGTTTSVAGDPATDFHNLGGAQGTGTVAGDVVVTSLKVTDLADASIISFPGGDGGIVAGKKWQNTAFSADVTSLDSQSGEQAGTRLTWGVLSTGYDSVTIADPATGEATPKNTAFEAFDLMAVSPISFTQDPQLKYDQVSAVELYNGTTWVPVTAPGGSWMNGTGFKGYTLTGAQSASTTGVRLVITPNDAARTGSSDPLTPPVGSGVGSSAVDSTGQTSRFFGLVWQLRNTVRVATGNPSPWATATHGFNDADPATIANAVGVSGERGGTPVTQVTATDKVSLLDVPPGVDVAKTASAATVVIPNDGDVASGIYPKITFTVTGQNTSLARASYLRVTDPMPCSAFAVGGCTSTPTGWDDNPFTTAPYTTDNPFERVNLTQIAFTVNAGQIDTAASNVILWHRSATGVLTTTTTTMATAAAMTEAQLQDVVGVSVVYQGTDPTVNGGTITSGAKPVMTLTTQARVYQRSDTTQLVKPFTIENYAFSQSYDPVLTPSGTASTPVDSANANVTLVDGTLDVTASKVFSPTTILEKNRANPISMTLGATQGGSTVATNEVTMEDSDQHFWSTFRLVSLGSVTPPVGSDQVRVDVQTNGSATWQLGSFAAQAALPAVDLTTVSGIRFIFNRLDNGVFSHSSPPANWSAQAVLSVALLDTLRGTATPVPFPTTVTNELKNSSQRFEDPAIYASASKQTAADLTLDPGSFALDVAKAPLNDLHTVEAGVSVPWTLKFTNAGTGYLNLSDIVDQLPPYLTFDLVDPTYSKSAGSTLSTGVTYTYDAPTKTVTFSWPNGGNRMAPGDTFTITLGIILEPGLTSSQTATNQFIVDTTQDLTSCVNSSGNGQSVLSGLGSKQCGTSNYVQPIAGASLVTFKGVRGDIGGTLVSGAVNTSNPAAPCVGDVGGFYRTPCAANTVVGGTDEWKLQAINSGTVDYTKLTLVEPLPFAGDRMLATGSDRGSTYRPVFDGAHGLDVTGLPTGTGFTWQVTTAADVCVGAGSISAWAGAPPVTPADPTCAAHPVAASWTDGATFTGNWADVTGLRIVLDFTARHRTCLRRAEALTSATARSMRRPARRCRVALRSPCRSPDPSPGISSEQPRSSARER